MAPRLLLDTNIVIRWLLEPARLSPGQIRALREETKRGYPVAVSAISLIELALLSERRRVRGDIQEVFIRLDDSGSFQILPLTTAIAAEMIAMGDSLRDPSDRVIVATARVHGLRLLTADARICESRLVPVVE